MRILLSLAESATFTSAVFTANLIFKNKIAWSYYAYMLLAFFCIAYGFNPRLQAEEPAVNSVEYIDWFEGTHKPDPQAASKEKMRVLLRLKQTALDKEDRKFYQDKVKFHMENGERTYRDAKNKCAFIPNWSDREKAYTCFKTAAAYFTASDPKSKLVIMTISLFIDYGLSAIAEWEYIDNKLYWSEYHYEMMEFYQEVLIQN